VGDRFSHASYSRLCGVTDAAEVLRQYSDIVLAQVDDALARMRDRQRRALRYSPEEVRELSRLCIEEARAALSEATRKSFAWRAFELAQRAEMIARSETSPPRERSPEEIGLSRRIVGHLRLILAKDGVEESRRKEIEALLEQELGTLKNGL
jgi:hypothetical protein